MKLAHEMHSHALSNVIGQLIIFQKKFRSQFYVRRISKFVMVNLQCLEYVGFIRTYILHKDLFRRLHNATVYLNYSSYGAPSVQGTRIFSTPGRHLHLSWYKFSALLYRSKNSLFLFSTSWSGVQPYSFFDNVEGNLKVGGVLLLSIV